MHRRPFLTSFSAGPLAAIAGCFTRRNDDRRETNLPRLRVDGRWVTDPDGNPVVLRGVNVVDPVWGVEHAAERGRDYWDTLRLATDEGEGWYATVLRIPIEPRSVRSVGLETVLEDYLDRAVTLAAERDAYVLIDYHAVERYDASSIDRRLRAFWERVAPRYADDPHVLYELFSDPTEPAAGGIEAWRTWRERATPWVSLVRERAPETPIVVGSPAWSSMTAYAAEEPFEHDDVLYAAHVYPSWRPSTWESTFGTPALEVPVFVTEWGYAAETPSRASYANGTTDEWGEPFREWLDTHGNVHWCASVFDSQRQPAMFDTDWTLLSGDDHMGSLVKAWLAERRDDHRPGEPTAVPTGEGTAPTPPRQATVTRAGETSVSVQWEDSRDGDGDAILQYRVRIDDREPEIVRGSTHSITLTDLAPNQEYEIELTAVDERGVESRAATVPVKTLERADPQLAIPLTDAPPAVDGTLGDAWQRPESHAIDRYLWGVRSPRSADWRALWDEDALYVLVDVTEPPSADGDATVDLYLDLDNSSAETYDGTNDLQLLVVQGSEQIHRGSNSAPLAEGLEASTAETDDGWRTVFTIPWAEYGVRPIVGHRLGVDVHLRVDRDDGSGKVSWAGELDMAWENPQWFAMVELGP